MQKILDSKILQGIKEEREKLFLSFRLSERVPKENFYRRLKETLDLSYLRKMTSRYYGTDGQKSIDTEVFFQIDVEREIAEKVSNFFRK